MTISKETLDSRICDVVPEAGNKQTYRRFIRETEDEFCIKPADLDSLSDAELASYLDFMDELWDK